MWMKSHQWTKETFIQIGGTLLWLLNNACENKEKGNDITAMSCLGASQRRDCPLLESQSWTRWINFFQVPRFVSSTIRALLGEWGDPRGGWEAHRNALHWASLLLEWVLWIMVLVKVNTRAQLWLEPPTSAQASENPCLEVSFRNIFLFLIWFLPCLSPQRASYDL